MVPNSILLPSSNAGQTALQATRLSDMFAKDDECRGGGRFYTLNFKA
jgi:hypothetical protein